MLCVLFSGVEGFTTQEDQEMISRIEKQLKRRFAIGSQVSEHSIIQDFTKQVKICLLSATFSETAVLLFFHKLQLSHWLSFFFHLGKPFALYYRPLDCSWYNLFRYRLHLLNLVLWIRMAWISTNALVTSCPVYYCAIFRQWVDDLWL